MAKITHGIDPALIEDPVERKFWQIVKNNFRETDRVFGGAVEAGNDPGSASATVDHGLLQGLADDDHAQYLLLAGRGGQSIADTITMYKLIVASSIGSVVVTPTAGNVTTFVGTAKTFLSGSLFEAGLGLTLTTSAAITGTASAPALRINDFGNSARQVSLNWDGTIDAIKVRTTSTPGFSGDGSGLTGLPAVATLTTRGDLLTRDATTQVRLPIGSSGKFLGSDGTDPAWDFVRETDILDDGIFAHLADDETISGSWFFSGNGANRSMYVESSWTGTGDDGLGFALYSTGVGYAKIGVNPTQVGDQEYTLPPVGTILLGATETANTSNKRLGTGTVIRMATTTSDTNGALFAEGSSTTAGFRINAGPITAAVVRYFTVQDYNAKFVMVGEGTAASQTLGSSDLTAQTGNIAATTLLTASSGSSGVFRVSFYVKCTTAGQAGDNVKVTVAYNDGSAQTVDVPFWPMAAAAPVVSQTVPLGNTSLNLASSGSVTVYAAASTAITFTTTMVNAAGAPDPQYTIRARIEAI